jgi:hypothetical protein
MIDSQQPAISVPVTAPCKADAVPQGAPPVPPVVIIPTAQPSDRAGQHRSAARVDKRHYGYYGRPLIRRGLLVLGCAVVGVAGCYYISWTAQGREPTTMPVWVGASGGLLVLVSFMMMFLGSQDENPRLHPK